MLKVRPHPKRQHTPHRRRGYVSSGVYINQTKLAVVLYGNSRSTQQATVHRETLQTELGATCPKTTLREFVTRTPVNRTKTVTTLVKCPENAKERRWQLRVLSEFAEQDGITIKELDRYATINGGLVQLDGPNLTYWVARWSPKVFVPGSLREVTRPLPTSGTDEHLKSTHRVKRS